MQEAVAWIEELQARGGANVTDTGKFTFRDVAIRADLLAHLIRENRVVKLNLSNARTSSSGLATLFDAASCSGVITGLRLEFIALDGTAWAALTKLMKRSKSIVGFHLWNLNILDSGVALICDALAENDVIEDLDLSQNCIGVEGARILGRFFNRNRTLTSLHLASNHFGNEGVVALADGIRSNESLRTLNLRYCGISDDGAIALASLLEHGSHLVELDLSDNEIGEAGLKALANSLKHNQHLRHLIVLKDPELEVEDAFSEALQSNVTLLQLAGIRSSEIENLLYRNKELIPAAVRRAALLLIGIRQSTDIAGMGDFAVFPKDIVRLIAQTVWAMRSEPVWIQALQ